MTSRATTKTTLKCTQCEKTVTALRSRTAAQQINHHSIWAHPTNTGPLFTVVK